MVDVSCVGWSLVEAEAGIHLPPLPLQTGTVSRPSGYASATETKIILPRVKSRGEMLARSEGKWRPTGIESIYERTGS